MNISNNNINNNETSLEDNDDTTKRIEFRHKDYKLNENKNNDAAASPLITAAANESNQTTVKTTKLDNNNHRMNSGQKKKSTAGIAPHTASSLSLSSSKKKPTLFDRLNNLTDFNLKFKSSELESVYFKSYLSVTRLIFIKYLLYVILFTLISSIYLIVTNSCMLNLNPQASSTAEQRIRLSGTVRKYQLTNGSYVNVYTPASSSTANETTPKWRLFLVIYLGVMLLTCLLIGVFLLYLELKERTFHNLQKRLAKKELDTKIDFRKAESDLKMAMQDVLSKENEYLRLKERLADKSKDISRLKDLYLRISYATALVVVLLVFVLCFLMFLPGNAALISQINHFIWFCEALILLYLLYPFQMLVSLGMGIALSVLFEILAVNRQINAFNANVDAAADSSRSNVNNNEHTFSSVYLQSQIIIFIFIKILLHTSIHIMVFYLKLSNQAIKRETFLKIAHMHKAHLAVKQDEIITERMIKSIMPPLFTHVFGKPEDFKKSVNCVHQMRPLFIYPVSEISILFADIVGFTRMSSTKTAEELVFLLNDLYGRFDKLCEQAGCEKISTLGDCYYCVSGCLNGRQDHANCCVEMGLLMVKEIEIFNKCHGVSVNMRVGVHTGNALCGFIGGKRFRFDVWSSDVTLANKMESTGRPGWVHISEDTFKLLDSKYKTEQGEKYSGKSTYFVVRESKRETVAALYENMLETSATETNSPPTNSIPMNDLNQSQQAASAEKANQERLLKEPSVKGKKDEDLLMLAIRDSQIIQPDVNIFTMRFKPAEEIKFQAYLMGLSGNHSTPQTEAAASANSLNIWANSQNILFVSFLISFIVNLCVSTGFFLTFIVSSMSSLEYKLTSKYKVNFIVILVVFFALCLIQLVFLIFNFINCTKKLNHGAAASAGSTSASSSTLPNIQSNKSFSTVNNNNHELLLNNKGGVGPGAGGVGYSANALDYNMLRMKSKTVKTNNRRILLRYVLLHVASFVLLSLIPIFILCTGLPILCNLIDYSWLTMFSTTDQPVGLLNSTTTTTTTAAPTTILGSVTQAAVDVEQSSDTIIDDYQEVINRKRFNLFSMYVYFCYTVLLIQFCSFVQLSSLFKSLLALAYALIFGLISYFGLCGNYRVELEQAMSRVAQAAGAELKSKISFDFYTTLFLKGFTRENLPILIDLGLLVLLIYLVNRQMELTQRLSFRNDQNTQSKITYAREQKELANWLIEVVLPSHVVGSVKEKKQYSRNYQSCGVLFVSLCNFSEFFEETYEGGRELLRVLNEITVDFDRLFDDPKYKNVEKIKSIGSTFMIASGLCPEPINDDDDDDERGRNDELSHLNDLLVFALELYEKLEAFNTEAMSVCHFKFQMRMGLNCGPLTSGIIGTERLLYDIWGDTVNVASRMDSTGQAGVIQTTERVVDLLKDQYKFTERGKVQIKGKDEMTTFFLNPKDSRI